MTDIKKHIEVPPAFSASASKIIAVVTMLIDHMGTVFSPSGFTYIIMRSVGRLAFPLFCFLITEGFIHTSDRKKYALRLGIFAIISEIPFDLAFHGSVFYPQSNNVFFTLLLGLLAIWIIDKYKDIYYIGAGVILLSSLLAEFIHCDYGWYGIALISIFYIFKNKKTPAIFLFIITTILYVISRQSITISLASVMNISITEYINKYLNMSIFGYVLNYCRQIFACFSAIFIGFYNGKKGFINSKKLRIAFYAFYPAHLIILYLLDLIIIK